MEPARGDDGAQPRRLAAAALAVLPGGLRLAPACARAHTHTYTHMQAGSLPVAAGAPGAALISRASAMSAVALLSLAVSLQTSDSSAGTLNRRRLYLII